MGFHWENPRMPKKIYYARSRKQPTPPGAKPTPSFAKTSPWFVSTDGDRFIRMSREPEAGDHESLSKYLHHDLFSPRTWSRKEVEEASEGGIKEVGVPE